jgi:DNA invertase Pin-like site-specific DNA recombinase
MGRGGDTFHSPDVQAAQVRARLAQLGISEVMAVEDLDRSGRTMDRPGLTQILEAVDAGQVDCVAVHELSRLGRNTADTLALVDRLRRRGVTIVSTVEQVDDTPEGQLALTMWLAIAQHYSDQIGRRWKQLAAHRTETKGQLHGSRPPLGYRRVGASIEPDELAPAMRVLFEGYAKGLPVHALCRALSAARGKATAVRVVKRCLGNPVYMGLVHLHGRTFPGAHEAIVDEATWTRVQRRLAADRVVPARTLGVPRHALVGLAVCDACGKKLRRITGGPAHGRTASLRCGTHVESGGCAGSGTMQVHTAEAEVLRQVEEYAQTMRDDAYARAAAKAKRVTGRADLARLERMIASEERALGRTAADYARRTISETAYQQAVREIEEHLEVLQGAAAEARQVAEMPAPRVLASAAAQLVRLWPAMDVGERNRALRALVREIRVKPAGGRGGLPPDKRVEVLFIT